MGVVVTTPATSHDLTTPGLVALELGLDPGDTTLQQKIGPLIAEVSDAIARYCGRTFARQTYTETVEGSGDSSLFLTHRPLVSITSITLDATAVPAADFRIESANGGRVQALSGTYAVGSWAFSAGYPRYTVIYVAGYILPGNVGENLPPALRRIATKAVAYEHQNGGRDRSITSRKLGDLSITYGAESGDTSLPAHICKALRAEGFKPSLVFA